MADQAVVVLVHIDDVDLGDGVARDTLPAPPTLAVFVAILVHFAARKPAPPERG